MNSGGLIKLVYAMINAKTLLS
uniref:Uncharacterized protein n=1 Tax=Anguilla anguilla TaxID=7936 RepID=A0A0E9WCH6_ANGAN